MRNIGLRCGGSKASLVKVSLRFQLLRSLFPRRFCESARPGLVRSMIRLFAALPIPGDIGLALARRQTGVEGARWRPLEALHVTLRFFGDIREDIARDLDAELMGVRGQPFDIELAGVGAFGEGPDLHVLWAGVAESEPLRRHAKACEGAARTVVVTLT